VYLVPILLYDWYNPRRRLPLAAPSLFSCLGQLSMGLILYDFIFYWIHLAMHRHPLLHRFHIRHHTRVSIQAGDVVRHSLVDGALQVCTNIFVLNILRLHPLVRLLYNILITYLLTEIHSSLDRWWMLHHVVPWGLYGGAPNHQLHHAHNLVCYHQFFTYLDVILGLGPGRYQSKGLDEPAEGGASSSSSNNNSRSNSSNAA
jgi:sterol desaturase/sphingolipid hydroxylase (fatty acid hydroxylase superfamily)